MKKIICLLVVVFLIGFAGCDSSSGKEDKVEGSKEESVVKLQDTRIEAPKEGLLDDFSEGIDESKWNICVRNWSAAVSNGQKKENVSYTEDGILLLKANGNKLDDKSMNRTGAVLVSKDTYGPGAYEVSMRILPRLGVCNAFWTYYYENDDVNHEIDIELPGKKTYQNVLNTNWTGVNDGQYTSIAHPMSNPLNDNNWHTYRFEWRTNPMSVTYYVDGVLTNTITKDVPTKAGNIWIGVWFPKDWCGTPDFETDYLMVDWVSYTPYLDQPYTKTTIPASQVSQDFPTTPVEFPSTNVLATSNLAGFEQGTLNLSEREVSQTIEEVFAGYSYFIECKALGDGYISVEYLDKTGGLLEHMDIINIHTTNETRLTKRVVAPVGTNQMKVTFYSGSNLKISNAKVIFES